MRKTTEELGDDYLKQCRKLLADTHQTKAWWYFLVGLQVGFTFTFIVMMLFKVIR